MKRRLILTLLIGVTGLLAGCRTAEPAETEMTRAMAEQMKAVRDQMKAASATAQQLREFDRANAQLKKNMGQMERTMERQMRAME